MSVTGQSELHDLNPDQRSGQSAEQLIRTFYTNFQQCNWRGMVECYHAEVFFYDPVFGNLEGPEACAMWEMLLSRAKGLTLSFSDITSDGEYGSCNWTAAYTFSATGRKVINNGKARFKFSEGKIVEHFDDFNLWKWSAQALGAPGRLFGWTSLLQNNIRRKARGNLEKFMLSKAR